MKAWIVQHDPDVDSGTTLLWLQNKQIKFEILQTWQKNFIFPEVAYNDLVFLCGGEMNVDQEQLHSWLVLEKLWLKKLIDSNVKLVGLCLGAQLLAESLGAVVQKNPVSEVGWHWVDYNGDFFKTPVFQWHSYCFDLPLSALSLGSSHFCKQQGFIYKNNILAFQFHPEASEAWVRDCAKDVSYKPSQSIQSQEEILKGLVYLPQMTFDYWKILDEFLIR